jgi:hypothetical protein
VLNPDGDLISEPDLRSGLSKRLHVHPEGGKVLVVGDQDTVFVTLPDSYREIPPAHVFPKPPFVPLAGEPRPVWSTKLLLGDSHDQSTYSWTPLDLPEDDPLVGAPIWKSSSEDDPPIGELAWESANDAPWVVYLMSSSGKLRQVEIVGNCWQQTKLLEIDSEVSSIARSLGHLVATCPKSDEVLVIGRFDLYPRFLVPVTGALLASSSPTLGAAYVVPETRDEVVIVTLFRGQVAQQTPLETLLAGLPEVTRPDTKIASIAHPADGRFLLIATNTGRILRCSYSAGGLKREDATQPLGASESPLILSHDTSLISLPKAGHNQPGMQDTGTPIYEIQNLSQPKFSLDIRPDELNALTFHPSAGTVYAQDSDRVFKTFNASGELIDEFETDFIARRMWATPLPGQVLVERESGELGLLKIPAKTP